MKRATKLLPFASLIVLLLGAVGCNDIANTVVGGEQEGVVKSDDCREQIMVQEGSPATYGKKFTCIYQKSTSGKLMAGVCTAIEMEGSTCKAAYTYQKAPWAKCPSHSHLEEDDRCLADPGFHWSPDQTVVVPNDPPASTQSATPDALGFRPFGGKTSDGSIAPVSEDSMRGADGQCRNGTHEAFGVCFPNPHTHWDSELHIMQPDAGYHWSTDLKTAEPDN